MEQHLQRKNYTYMTALNEINLLDLVIHLLLLMVKLTMILVVLNIYILFQKEQQLVMEILYSKQVVHQVKQCVLQALEN